MIGERIRAAGTSSRLVYPGLRLNRRRAGKTGVTLVQPKRRLRTRADNAKGVGLLELKWRCLRRGGENSANELAERALVFLVDARAFGSPVRLYVRPDRRRRGRCTG